jgi:glutamyl-tRNA reductase
MAVTVVGINHRGAPLEIRERIAYRQSEIASELGAIIAACGGREGVLLSTCNRTEVYVVVGADECPPAVWNALSTRLGEEASGYG